MAVENDFLIFANSASNIESQASYVNDPIVAAGFGSGITPSASMNKVLRQGTTGTALLAAFIQQQLPNQPVLDQGESGLAALLASYTQALLNFLKTQPITQNSVTSTTGTTLTAAEMVGFPEAFIQREGPSAAFTDTTDTAANLIAAACPGNPVLQAGFVLTIVNTTSYTQTIAGGTGVSIIGTSTVSPSTWRKFVGQVTNTSTPTVTLTSYGSGGL